MRTSANSAEHRPISLLLMGAGLLLVVAALDRLTGTSFSFAFFYLAPIYFVAWYVGTFAATTFAVLSYLILTVMQAGLHQRELVASLLNPNSITALVFFMVTAVLLARLSSAYRRERNLSSHDHLTGVFNRREFFNIAEIERLKAERYARAMTVVFIDIDDFKAVNDHFGHAAGDVLLATVARTLKSCVRATDLVARLGGDEFILLLEETAADDARLVVEKVREVLASELAATSSPVTASMGVITFLAPPSTVDAMVHAADELMYAAKHAGGDRAIFRVSRGGFSSIDSRAAEA